MNLRGTECPGWGGLRKVKSAFSSYRHVGPVVQPGMPIDGAEERPVCRKRHPRIRKVAGPNPARSTTNPERIPFSAGSFVTRGRSGRKQPRHLFVRFESGDTCPLTGGRYSPSSRNCAEVSPSRKAQSDAKALPVLCADSSNHEESLFTAIRYHINCEAVHRTFIIVQTMPLRENPLVHFNACGQSSFSALRRSFHS